MVSIKRLTDNQKGHILTTNQKDLYCYKCMTNLLENLNKEGFYYCKDSERSLCKSCEFKLTDSCDNFTHGLIKANLGLPHNHFFITILERSKE